MKFGKKYATLNEKLQCLYEEAYSLMQEDTNSEPPQLGGSKGASFNGCQ